jgi:hypothetical protein
VAAAITAGAVTAFAGKSAAWVEKPEKNKKIAPALKLFLIAAPEVAADTLGEKSPFSTLGRNNSELFQIEKEPGSLLFLELQQRLLPRRNRVLQRHALDVPAERP